MKIYFNFNKIFLIFKLTTIEQFWSWLKNDYVNVFEKNSNDSRYSYFKYKLDDQASYLIRFPIIRQLRTKNGKKIFLFYLFQLR